LLNINKDWKRIGISLSGGADSALLAYLICKTVSTTTEIHINTQIRCWKTRPWQEHVADNVIAWLKITLTTSFMYIKI